MSRPPPAALDPTVQPWLTAIAVATLAPHVDHLPPWLSAASALLIAWSTWRWRRGRPALHRFPLMLLVIAGIASMLAEYRSIFGQEPGVALLALFLALKLLEIRARRDAIAVVMLGYFLLLTHYFYAESILVGIWMLTAMVIVTTTLIRIQSPAAPIDATVRLAGVMILQSLPLMLVLFMLFPRISGPLWGLPQDSRKATTGLTDQMTPGSISELAQSGAIAFRAQFPDKAPEKHSLYWRGPVMDDYDGRTWRASRNSSLPGESPRIEALGDPIAYALTLEPHQQRWLLALDLPTELPAGASFNASFSLVRRDPVRDRLRYSSVSVTEYRVNPREAPDLLRRARAIPPAINPRARELAAGWRSSAGGPEAIAARALLMFREQSFIYTVRPPLLGQNAIDQFLFETRRGFCEHYASAFVFLMRAAGVPARVVGGYQGGEFNPVDGFMVVRQSDAHAWAEIWVEGRGWIRVDPTAAIAPSRIEQGLAASVPAGEPLPAIVRGGVDWVRTLRYRWEALNNFWNQWILGYDAERQRTLLSRLGMGTDWRQMVSSMALLAGLTVLVIGAWAMRRIMPRDPAQRLWLTFCKRMSMLGLPRHSWEGPEDYAHRITCTAPEHAERAVRAAKAYGNLRYGHPAPDELTELRAALRGLPILPYRRRKSHRP